jgi:hypothetical protein
MTATEIKQIAVSSTRNKVTGLHLFKRVHSTATATWAVVGDDTIFCKPVSEAYITAKEFPDLVF